MTSSNKTLKQTLDHMIQYLNKNNIKTTKPENKGICYETILLTENTPIFLYTYPGKHTNNPITAITTTKNDCINTLYNPNTLYHTPIEPPQKLLTKIQTLTKTNK